VTILSPEAHRILVDGVLCHLAATTPRGPHLTPLVYAVAGDRVWVTTSRGSAKARAWRRDDRVAGLVRVGERALTFGARVASHDALDPASWIRSALEGPLVALASARFTRRNARFFAGYAVDANHVPLAWTPPGRVFAELRLERWAVLDGDAVGSTWGDWPEATPSPMSGRATRMGRGATMPVDLDGALGRMGVGALAVAAATGSFVAPARWARTADRVEARVARPILALAGEVPAPVPVALEVDRVAAWRAREMVGAMLRGAASLDATDGDVVVRWAPDRVVWWRGWESGTVVAA
jgi:hypothetical protein